MSKFFLIILSLTLSLPISVWAVDSVELQETNLAVIENVQDKEFADEPQAPSKTDFKQPLSKRKLAKKFLIAMGAVAASSFALFFILTVYNKIRENYMNQVKNIDGETTLETPDNINNAVRIFLDKTKW